MKAALLTGHDEPATGFDLFDRCATLDRTQAAVEHHDRNASAPERVLLVRHEGNEWRHAMAGRSRINAGT